MPCPIFLSLLPQLIRKAGDFVSGLTYIWFINFEAESIGTVFVLIFVVCVLLRYYDSAS